MKTYNIDYNLGYKDGQQSKQQEIDSLKEALKYMLDQLDHPYRASGERIENKVNMILNKLTTKPCN